MYHGEMVCYGALYLCPCVYCFIFGIMIVGKNKLFSSIYQHPCTIELVVCMSISMSKLCTIELYIFVFFFFFCIFFVV